MASFLYLRKDEKYFHEKPYIYESNISYEQPVETNTEKDLHRVALTDIRGQEAKFSYDTHGFRFINHESQVKQSGTEVHDTIAYINETKEILKVEFDAMRVICYDVRVRAVTFLAAILKS